jgi:hypothetical protein
MSLPASNVEYTCTTCHSVKPAAANFKHYKNRVSPTTGVRLPVNKKCNTCTKEYTVEKRIAVANAPTRPALPHPCDNCTKPIVTAKTLQLDHDHKTHAFRGWLCKECNISMGNLGDNVRGMLRAAVYLDKTEKMLTKQELSVLQAILARSV